MGTTLRRLIALVMAFALIAAACGGGGSSDDGEVATEDPSATTAPAPESEPEPVPGPEPEPEPEFEPPAAIALDDPQLAIEPVDASYRALLTFSMRALLADGTVQEGIVTGDGGKLLPDTHAMVIDTEGLTTLPDCVDLAALSPNYESAYHTFYGGLSGEAGGDLMGEAQLSDVGIMSNGVLVDRYQITLDNIDPDAESEYSTLSEAYMDIARDGGYVVRLVLSGTGRNNTFSIDQSEPREINYDLNFSQFGTITEFTAPPGCFDDEAALDVSGDLAVVNWGATNPTYIAGAGGADDPYFHIHTSNEADGFFLGFELYTVYGQEWTGQTGTFDIDCSDPTTSTGICVHFDPDGPGPLPDIGADFGASGMVTISQLDSGGYEVQVDSLSFTDGTTFAPFTMTG